MNFVKVAFKTKRVVSVGCARRLSIIGFGAAIADRAATVVAVGELRFTSPASVSVPVLTDQRSTPHCAKARVGRNTKASAMKINDCQTNRFIAILLNMPD